MEILLTGTVRPPAQLAWSALSGSCPAPAPCGPNVPSSIARPATNASSMPSRVGRLRLSAVMRLLPLVAGRGGVRPPRTFTPVAHDFCRALGRSYTKPGVDPYARQWLAVKSTSTGTISSRPRYMSAVRIERGEVAERREGAHRAREAEPGPKPPSVVIDAASDSNARQLHARAARSRADRQRARGADAEEQEDEDDDRAQRALVDGLAVDAERRDHLRMDGLVDLAPQHLGDHDVTDQLDRAAGRSGRGAQQRRARTGRARSGRSTR